MVDNENVVTIQVAVDVNSVRFGNSTIALHIRINVWSTVFPLLRTLPISFFGQPRYKERWNWSSIYLPDNAQIKYGFPICFCWVVKWENRKGRWSILAVFVSVFVFVFLNGWVVKWEKEGREVEYFSSICISICIRIRICICIFERLSCKMGKGREGGGVF